MALSGGAETPAGNKSGEAGIDHAGMIVGNPGARGSYNVQIAQHSRNTIKEQRIAARDVG